MIKKILNGKSKSITSAALVIGLLSLGSRFLGMLRDRILAGQFGASNEMDMYLAAFRIPDFFYNLIILGALSAGFIPIFTGYLNLKKENETEAFQEGWVFVNNLLNILLFFLVVFISVFFLLASFIMPFIVPGFNKEQTDITIALTRIMFLSPIFLGVSGIFGGILQSFRLFFVYSLAPIMYNAGIIIGALVFVKYWGIYGLAYGVVLGAFLHMAVQLPLVLQLGYRYAPLFNWRHPKIRLVGRMMVPRFLNLTVNQINILAITIIASTLAGGSISIYYYADNLQGMLLGTIGVSFALAVFPVLSIFANNNDQEKFLKTLSGTARQILFLIIPASMLLVVLRAQMVRVIYGTMKFTWEDTRLTLESVQFFALSLFAQCLIPLLVRAFWARNNTKTPLIVSAAGMIINISLALMLSAKMGVTGLALAFSISSVFNLFLLIICLKKELRYTGEKEIIISAIKIIFASLISGLAAYEALHIAAPLVDMHTFLGILAQGVFAGITGILVYILVCNFMKLPEFMAFKKSFQHRLFKTKVVVTEIAGEK